MRSFFKKIHEVLYEIEQKKEVELNGILSEVLGKFNQSGGLKETDRFIEKCRKSFYKIGTRIDQDEFVKTASKFKKYSKIIE